MLRTPPLISPPLVGLISLTAMRGEHNVAPTPPPAASAYFGPGPVS